jgi:membrane peptidoglycan carboxypeptidase
MLAAYNTIANGGVYVAPKLVAATIDTDGRTHPTAPSPEHRVVSPEVAQQMTTMLGEVVRVGTGQTAKIDGYTVAGKTGTARIPLQDARGYMNNVYTSSFAGFVPSAHPQMTSIIVLDQTPLFGGVAAAPVFSTVASYALREFRIAPVAAQPPAAGVPLATPATALAAGETLSPGAAAPKSGATGMRGNTGAGTAVSPARSSPSTTQVPAQAATISGGGGPTTTTTSRPARP